MRSLANERMRWQARQALAKKQRSKAALRIANAIKLRGCPSGPPWTIHITRIGKRYLDSDNLEISAKHIRDGIADALGVDDKDFSQGGVVEWKYSQELGKSFRVRVIIKSKERG